MRIRLLLLIFMLLPYFAISQEITLEDIWLAGKYRAEYPASFHWTNDDNYIKIEKDSSKNNPSFNLYSINNGYIRDLTANLREIPEGINPSDYQISKDLTKILFAADEEAIYRRSSKANYYIFDVKTGAFAPLHDFEKGKISYPTFAPNNMSVAFVRNNNLFYVDISSMKEIAITIDGKYNEIINGACDWVYEEEFEFAQAFFWSPNSKKIAYYRFDESKVKEYNMQLWGDTYPTDYRYKYPKVGEENSSIKLNCYALDDNTTLAIDQSIPGEKEYFPRMQWTGNSNIISYNRMNRLQNKLEIIHYNLLSRNTSIVYQEKNETYIEINDNHFYFPVSEDFVFTSEQSGYRHIYRYSKMTNSIKALTMGAYEISEILGIDNVKKLIYYTAQEESPLEKQLYSIDFSGKKKKQLTTEKGVHTISFSPNFNFYIDTYANLNTPPINLLKETSKHKILDTLGSNVALRKLLKETTTNPMQFFNYITTEGTNLNGWMLKPIGFDSTKKYPVLLTVYGGPGSQEVMNTWKGFNYFWYQLLAQKGYLIVCIDGRGTGGRGTAFKKCTQFNLGKYETEDLIETAKYLQKSSYVDANRIGIFGWSFGGYLSSLAITKGSDYFKAAIAVAPVTNWRHYDNIYTERYMGLPSENGKGYDENAPAYFANLLKGNYLLIHGTADDNVHLQNSIEMQRALIKANKQFDMFYYPDRNHSIYGGNTRYHLYKMMTEFILKKL